MNTKGNLALAVLAGISIGAVSVMAVHAQEAKTPPAYLFAEQPRVHRRLSERSALRAQTARRVRTTWPCDKRKPGANTSVAMPHGWAIAEFWLFMRDSIAFEDDSRIVLLGGIPKEWFRHRQGMQVKGLTTYFGPLDLGYRRVAEGAELRLAGAEPPGGSVLRVPPALGASVWRGSDQLAACLMAQENRNRPEGSQIPGPHGNSAQPAWLSQMEGWTREQPSAFDAWLADIRAWRDERLVRIGYHDSEYGAPSFNGRKRISPRRR